MRTRRRRLGGMVVVVALAIGTACGGSEGGGNNRGNGEVAAGSTTTAPAPAITVTTVAVSPTRIEQELARLFAVRNQIFRTPDPARVGEYALPECQCHQVDRDDLAGLAERTEYWDTPQLELRGARVASRPADGEVLLEAAVGRPRERVKNRTGALIGGQGDGLPNFAVRVVLRRGDAGWRFAEVSRIELPSETVSAIAAAGIPGGPADEASRL